MLQLIKSTNIDGIFWKNLTLGVVKVLWTVLETSGNLQIKSMRYDLKFLMLGGSSAGPKGALGLTVAKKRNSSNADKAIRWCQSIGHHKRMKKYENTYDKTSPIP